MVRTHGANGGLFIDYATPLPTEAPDIELLRTFELSPHAPAEAQKYVRNVVDEVRRPNGDIGHQVRNVYADGVSLFAVIIKDGRAYLVLHDEWRWPTRQWSREAISGGVRDGETQEEAALREASEEAGIFGIDVSRLRRLSPAALFSSISTNDQPFNLFWAIIAAEEWDNGLLMPDPEEGNIHNCLAYDLRVVREMLGRQIVELSTWGGINALLLQPELQQYL